MLNKYLKLSLAIVFGIIAVWQFIEVNIGWGLLCLLLSGLSVLLIYRHERILVAFYHMRKGDIELAQASIEKIKNPDALVKGQRAYYHLLLGMMLAQTQGIHKTEKYFVKALSIGLRNKQDQALAKLNLAGVCAAKRKKREAVNYLNQAKKLDTKGMLTEQIKTMKSQMGRI